MPNSNSVQQWNLRMIAGSIQQWVFTFTTTAPGGVTPYEITGAGWEYVIRLPGDDSTGTPVLSLTTTPGVNGQLVVTNTASLSAVLLDMYPAATVALAPGTYQHALYIYPGASNQYAWVTGSLILEGAPQP